MAAQDKQGTFWVIEGVKVRKKEPFAVTYVPRILVESPQKSRKGEGHESVHQGPGEIVTGGNFFTDKSYEDMADRRMDYGMIRISSLNEVRGGELFSLGNNQQGTHNFTVCPSNDNMRVEQKYFIFANDFVRFNFPAESYQEEQNLQSKMLL